MALYNPIVVNTTVNSGGSQISNNVVASTVFVPADLTVAQILAPQNANRKGLAMWNDSQNPVYIDFGITPTTERYAFKFNPDGYYETPFGFTGEIQGLWAGSGGIGIFVREFV